MAYKRIDNLFFENAQIIYRNFSGLEKRSPTGKVVNEEGSRNFCVIIDDTNTAEALKEDGWNVKIRMPKEDGDSPIYYLPIKVRFDRVPPKIWLVTTSNGHISNKTLMDETSVGMLDNVDLTNVDLEINPYHREGGITAYLKEGYFTIAESRFSSKYDIDDNNEEVPF